MPFQIRTIFLFLVLLFPLAISAQVKNSEINAPLKIEGTTMGTTYHITYFDKQKRNFKVAVDSLLSVVNRSISNYDPNSDVSQFNKALSGYKPQLPYLLPPLQVAKEIYQLSDGAFDMTVMPLVDAWGFGPGKAKAMDSTKVDSIKAFVGFDKVQFNNDSIWKSDPRVQLDFGGIGQGYGADIITKFLTSKGIMNMLVELGGEGMACGINLQSGKPWTIGILDPNSTRENQFFKVVVSLKDKSFTTSGNYFNYREVNGKRYSHTIDPATGFPAQRAILSASVFSKDCASADAWATAFMVMGHERAMEVLTAHTDIDAILMYTTVDGDVKVFVTKGIEAVDL